MVRDLVDLYPSSRPDEYRFEKMMSWFAVKVRTIQTTRLHEETRTRKVRRREVTAVFISAVGKAGDIG